jgi:hypothetical protein
MASFGWRTPFFVGDAGSLKRMRGGVRSGRHGVVGFDETVRNRTSQFRAYASDVHLLTARSRRFTLLGMHAEGQCGDEQDGERPVSRYCLSHETVFGSMSLRAIYPFVDVSDVTQSTVAEKAIEQRRFVASLATSKLSASFAD